MNRVAGKLVNPVVLNQTSSSSLEDVGSLITAVSALIGPFIGTEGVVMKQTDAPKAPGLDRLC